MTLNNFILYIKNPIISNIKIVIKTKILPSLKVIQSYDNIESEKNKALNDIKKMVVEVAIEASEKIVKRNLNTDDNKRMAEETVDSFKQKN